LGSELKNEAKNFSGHQLLLVKIVTVIFSFEAFSQKKHPSKMNGDWNPRVHGGGWFIYDLPDLQLGDF